MAWLQQWVIVGGEGELELMTVLICLPNLRLLSGITPGFPKVFRQRTSAAQEGWDTICQTTTSGCASVQQPVFCVYDRYCSWNVYSLFLSLRMGSCPAWCRSSCSKFLLTSRSNWEWHQEENFERLMLRQVSQKLMLRKWLSCQIYAKHNFVISDLEVCLLELQFLLHLSQRAVTLNRLYNRAVGNKGLVVLIMHSRCILVIWKYFSPHRRDESHSVNFTLVTGQSQWP